MNLALLSFELYSLNLRLNLKTQFVGIWKSKGRPSTDGRDRGKRGRVKRRFEEVKCPKIVRFDLFSFAWF